MNWFSKAMSKTWFLENRKLGCMHKCTMVFKCRNGVAPPYLIDSFNANTFNHN